LAARASRHEQQLVRQRRERESGQAHSVSSLGGRVVSLELSRAAERTDDEEEEEDGIEEEEEEAAAAAAEGELTGANGGDNGDCDEDNEDGTPTEANLRASDHEEMEPGRPLEPALAQRQRAEFCFNGGEEKCGREEGTDFGSQASGSPASQAGSSCAEPTKVTMASAQGNKRRRDNCERRELARLAKHRKALHIGEHNAHLELATECERAAAGECHASAEEALSDESLDGGRR